MNKWTKLILLAFVGGLVLTGLSYVVSKGETVEIGCYIAPNELRANSSGTIHQISYGFPAVYYSKDKQASATCHQYPPDGSSNNKDFSSLDAVGFAKDLIIWTAASFVVLSVLSLTGRKK
jgi:hypothetical protein